MWMNTKLAAIRRWPTPGLASLTLEACLDFEPGQYANLGLRLDGKREKRPYSLASPPGAPVEVLVAAVPGGGFTSHLLELEPGDPLELSATPAGFFTLAEVPEDWTRTLWMVATGTGLGPYLSILRAGRPWPRFERAVLVHGVRERGDLAFADELRAMDRVDYVPLVSREDPPDDGLAGRCTVLLDSGALEGRAGPLGDDAHVMLCGNPKMVSEMSERLAARGLERSTRNHRGRVTVERYW